jgi:hypothetical protein
VPEAQQPHGASGAARYAAGAGRHGREA